jgi:hypothetical protein
MQLIGYMLNTYDEGGPEDIRVVAPDADIQVTKLGLWHGTLQSLQHLLG